MGKEKLLKQTGNSTLIKYACCVKAPLVQDSVLSYPHFSAFGTKMATLFLQK